MEEKKGDRTRRKMEDEAGMVGEREEARRWRRAEPRAHVM
jgi:hypothetical protein